MLNKKTYILLVSSLIFLSFSCSNPQKELIGFWENNEKILEFTEQTFVIYNKTYENVIAFSGVYKFAQEPEFALKMSYKYAMDTNGNWASLEGTDLENYVDIILFKIDNNFLQTKVLGNGKYYTYTKISNPLEDFCFDDFDVENSINQN